MSIIEKYGITGYIIIVITAIIFAFAIMILASFIYGLVKHLEEHKKGSSLMIRQYDDTYKASGIIETYIKRTASNIGWGYYHLGRINIQDIDNSYPVSMPIPYIAIYKTAIVTISIIDGTGELILEDNDIKLRTNKGEDVKIDSSAEKVLYTIGTSKMLANVVCNAPVYNFLYVINPLIDIDKIKADCENNKIFDSLIITNSMEKMFDKIDKNVNFHRTQYLNENMISKECAINAMNHIVK
jgi:hypothetical protein